VHRQHRAGTRLQTCVARLESLSPLSVLGRGYSVVWDEARTRVLRSAAETRPGDRIRVTLSRGELQCSVTSTDE
jgi:exodeoxyribonuclease VII large subunit